MRMRELASRGFDESLDQQLLTLLRQSIPIVTCLVAASIDLLPIPNASPLSVAPNITLCAIFFWCLHRPDILGTGSCFVCGIFIDAVGGTPLALTSLVLLSVRTLLMTPKRFLLAKSFPVVWFCFGLMAIVAELLRWLLNSLVHERLLALEPSMLVLCLTFAAYPAVSIILSACHALIPQPSDLADE